jgi:Carboxypeptidase regulatory-like domain
MRKRLFAVVSLIPLLTASLYAQLATTTSLVGTVSDTSGKSIPNAKVTAVEAGTQDTHTTVTTEQGYYSIEFVRVGTYNISVECPGFQKVTKTGITVDINQTVRNDVT